MPGRSKIDQLPEEVRREVEKLLVDGVDCRTIAEHLRQLGHDVSKSSVHRWEQGFMQRIEVLRMVREKASAIVSEAGTGLEMDEAAHQMAMDLMIRSLMEMGPEALKKSDPVKMFSALAQLQSAGVKREKLKATERKARAAEAAERIEKHPEVKALPEEVRTHILQELYGIAA